MSVKKFEADEQDQDPQADQLIQHSQIYLPDLSVSETQLEHCVVCALSLLFLTTIILTKLIFTTLMLL